MDTPIGNIVCEESVYAIENVNINSIKIKNVMVENKILDLIVILFELKSCTIGNKGEIIMKLIKNNSVLFITKELYKIINNAAIISNNEITIPYGINFLFAIIPPYENNIEPKIIPKNNGNSCLSSPIK